MALKFCNLEKLSKKSPLMGLVARKFENKRKNKIAIFRRYVLKDKNVQEKLKF
jgi:hypothetical protein